MSERPTTYVQWRKVFQDNVYAIGVLAGWYWKKNRRISITREMWKLLHRNARLERRMAAEWEAFDATCAVALLDVIFGKAERI